MAQEKVVKLKVDSNVEKITKDYKKLNKEIEEQHDIVKDTNDAVEDLDKSTSKYAKKTTKAYQTINKSAKKLQDSVKGTGEVFNAGTETIGFYGDAMSLVGAESEKLEENLKLVDQAMRLSKGVKGVKESVKAVKSYTASTKIMIGVQTAFSTIMGTSTGLLKVFRIALISTGIGALVVGLGMLIANFEKIIGVFDPVIQGLKDFGDWIGLTSFAEEERNEKAEEIYEAEMKRSEARMKQLEKEEKRYKRYSESRITQLELQRRRIEGNADEELKIDKKIQAEKIRSLEEQKEAVIKQQTEILRRQEAHERKIWNQQGKNSKARLKQYEINAKLRKQIREKDFQDIFELEQQIQAVKLDTLDIEREAELKAQEEREKRYERYKQNLQDRLNAEREIEDLRLSAKLTALETEQRLLKAKGDEFEEERIAKEQEIFEQELEIKRINFQREYDDVLKDENLTTTEKNKIRKAKEEEWNATEKQLRSERDAQALEDLQDQLEKEDALRDKANEDRIKKEDAIFQLELQLMKDREFAEIIELTASYDKKFELAVDNAELEKQLEDQLGKDIEAIREKYRKMDEEADKKALQGKIDKATAQVNVGIDALRLISDIAEATAGDDVRRQKRAFNIKKASDIASATMDGFKAVLSAYAQAPLGFKIPASVIAGAFAGLQISNIAKQKFEGGGGNVESSSKAGGGAGGGDIITPEFNIVGGEELTDLEGVGQQPLQAYVVSGDVTSAQSLDRNRVENATF